MLLSKTKIIFIVSLILIIILSGSYAYLSIIRKESDTYTFSTGCLNITLNNANNFLNVEKAIPVTDIEGLKEVGYTFSIENKCNNKSKYEINLESLNTNTISDDYIKVSLSSNTFDNIISKLISNKERDHLLEDTNKSYNIYTGELNENEIKTFTLKEWLDYDTPNIGASIFQNKLNIISNPEIEVEDTNEVKFNLESENIIANITSEASQINYCETSSNVCEPSNNIDAIDKTISIANNSDERRIICIKVDNNRTTCSNEVGIFKGKGTEEDPYKIEYIDDLVTLSNKVNAGNSYEGAYFELTRNIDFQKEVYYQDKTLKDSLTSGEGFIPIGIKDANRFKGNINGNNYRIDNLFENKTNSRAGLIGIAENSTIINLTISGNITSTSNFDMGGFIANAYNVTIKNSINEINITAADYSNGGFIGAVASMASATIIDSINKGNLTGGNTIGGLIGCGASNSNNIIIENSYNEGTITNNTGIFTGGLIGRDSTNGTTTTIINNSYNKGQVIDNVSNITQSAYVGGIVGEIYNNITIENSYNEGEVKSNRTEFNGFIQIDIGGLVGVIAPKASTDSKIKIINSYNAGKITNGSYTGGLVGFNTNNSTLLIDKSFNNAIVDNTNLTFSDTSRTTRVVTGGLIGFNHGVNTKAYVLNSYNLSEINGFEVTSGIIGLSNHDQSFNYIINSYNVGDISNKSTINGHVNGIGRFTKDNNTVYLNNIYNFGSLTSKGLNYLIASTSKPTYSGNNIYHLPGTAMSLSTATTTPLAENQLLNKEQYNNKLFVDILNENISSIDLTSITQELQTAGLLENTETLSLSYWIIGPNGYPIFDYQK